MRSKRRAKVRSRGNIQERATHRPLQSRGRIRRKWGKIIVHAELEDPATVAATPYHLPWPA